MSLKRDYSLTDPLKPLVLCELCHRNFKSPKKHKRHIELDHRFCTRHCNPFSFTLEEKARVYWLMAEYVYSINQLYHEDFQVASFTTINLLPQFHDQDIPSQDFARIKVLHKEFIRRFAFNYGHVEMEWERAVEDFECYLSCGLPHFDTNFNPTLIMDLVWHSVMQDWVFYVRICERAYGKGIILPHCTEMRPIMEDTQRGKYFEDVFKYKFRRYPYHPDLERLTKCLCPNRDEDWDIKFKKMARELRELHIKTEELVRQKREEAAEKKRKLEEARILVSKSADPNTVKEARILLFAELTGIVATLENIDMYERFYKEGNRDVDRLKSMVWDWENYDGYDGKC